MYVRFKPVIFAMYSGSPTRYKPQWRKRPGDAWKDEFISAFDNLADAKLWARREYGPNVTIVEYTENA